MVYSRGRCEYRHMDAEGQSKCAVSSLLATSLFIEVSSLAAPGIYQFPASPGNPTSVSQVLGLQAAAIPACFFAWSLSILTVMLMLAQAPYPVSHLSSQNYLFKAIHVSNILPLSFLKHSPFKQLGGQSREGFCSGWWIGEHRRTVASARAKQSGEENLSVVDSSRDGSLLTGQETDLMSKNGEIVLGSFPLQKRKL